MILHIAQEREILDISIISFPIQPIEAISSSKDKYHKHSDNKWIKFCKEHHFHPYKDANGKIYDLYLQLCAEGII